MENEFLNAFSTSVTIISSVVAIAAVSICSILSSVITQYGAKKTKQTELLFQEMVTAYYDYLRIYDELSDITDAEQLTRFSNASTRALLFASAKTQRLIAEHGQGVFDLLVAEKTDKANVLERAERVGTTRGLLIKAMQKDLRK